MKKNKGAYDYYIIMSHFRTDSLKHVSFTDDVIEAIKELPKEKLIIMDNPIPQVDGALMEIYQDFENDIYSALQEGLPKISKYEKLILTYPESSVYPYPRKILLGFRKFCIEHSLDFEIINEIYEDLILKKGDFFITINESDLVSLIKEIRDKEFKLGEDLGVISYNDTPLKELLGITCISTDFKVMGETVAQMILDKKKGKIMNPFNFIDRNSM